MLCLLSIFSVSCLSVQNPKTSVIVDTDMGLDDVRTILLLLNSPDVRIAGFVVTEGASDVDAGVANLRRLLAYFDASHIPVVRGVALGIPTPPWREHSNAMGWVDELIDLPPVQEPKSRPTNLNALINNLNRNTISPHPDEGDMFYLALGPLSTLADALDKDPELPRNFSHVYFSGTGPSLEPSWNRSCDPDAYEAATAAPWQFVAFGRPDAEEMTITPEFIDKLSRIETPAAALIAALHKSPHIDRLVRAGHLKLWDDPIALFLNQPELAEISLESQEKQIYQRTDLDTELAEAIYLDLLSSADP